jgi:hypothetical protein
MSSIMVCSLQVSEKESHAKECMTSDGSQFVSSDLGKIGPPVQKRLYDPSEIPPHGSGWMVQIQPTRHKHADPANPTNGSWWMVQIQP